MPHVTSDTAKADPEDGTGTGRDSTEQLIDIVQQLSRVHDLPSVMAIVRQAARRLTGADGATFILRERDQCYYADEDAITPLWKGKRFPMSACISGWVMLNMRPAVIKDIYNDPRIPADAYRPTFVKSLAVVPIRSDAPVGAIGTYWATPHKATTHEVNLLQALANSTAIAMKNVQLYAELEQRVQERTAQLEAANKELEAFSYSVSHDLRAPLRSIDAFSALVLKQSADRLEARGRDHLEQVRAAVSRMHRLIDDLLRLAGVVQANARKESVDLSRMANEIASDLQEASSPGQYDFVIEEGVVTQGDPQLLRLALENLLSNAWKYAAKQSHARIAFGVAQDGQNRVYYVEDDGVGFDMALADRLFVPFQRLHGASDFPGTGVGLATVERVVQKHGGRIWAESAVGNGARFFFTLSTGDASGTGPSVSGGATP